MKKIENLIKIRKIEDSMIILNDRKYIKIYEIIPGKNFTWSNEWQEEINKFWRNFLINTNIDFHFILNSSLSKDNYFCQYKLNIISKTNINNNHLITDASINHLKGINEFQNHLKFCKKTLYLLITKAYPKLALKEIFNKNKKANEYLEKSKAYFKKTEAKLILNTDHTKFSITSLNDKDILNVLNNILK